MYISTSVLKCKAPKRWSKSDFFLFFRIFACYCKFLIKMTILSILQFSHICALFWLHLEGGTSQQPFKSCLAFFGIGTKQKSWKKQISTSFEVCSTQMLVKLYNTRYFCNTAKKIDDIGLFEQTIVKKDNLKNLRCIKIQTSLDKKVSFCIKIKFGNCQKNKWLFLTFFAKLLSIQRG